MLTIGDFARLAGVSVRMLRHYDTLGLLTPRRIDPSSGYRFYSAEQLDRANRLVALKDLGFGLDAIKPMLDGKIDADQMRALLRQRRSELADQISADAGRLQRVEQHLRAIESEETMQAESVTTKSLPGLQLAQFSERATDQAEIGPLVGPLFQRLPDALAKAGVSTDGIGIGHYLADSDGVHVGVGEALTSTPSTDDRQALDSVGLELIELAPVNKAVCLTHTGPIEDIAAAWVRLTQEAERMGLQQYGPCREIYHATPLDAMDEWVYELQQPVR